MFVLFGLKKNNVDLKMIFVFFFLLILLCWTVTVVKMLSATMHVSFRTVGKKNDHWIWTLLLKSVTYS